MATEKRLIDANVMRQDWLENGENEYVYDANAVLDSIDAQPTVDAVEVVHGRWELTAHEEYSNYRWNVTAECSECHHSKGEVYAGFFPGFPQELARMTVLDCAKSVKLDNYCPNCGAKMMPQPPKGE